jgi:DNA-binding transcriptional ArsR family regulator
VGRLIGRGKHSIGWGPDGFESAFFSLDIFSYRNILSFVARAATTSDVFNAIAEPRRREIVDLLALGAQRDVTELVLKLGLPQPAVSKHLGVLRKVGVVAVQRAGQRRVYRLNPQKLKPVHDWIQTFERFWTDQLAGIKEAAEQKAKQLAARDRAASNHQPLSKEKKS